MAQEVLASPLRESSLADRFGRQITYLRISVTEHCNFRCVYCSPAGGTPFFARKDHLQIEEYDRLIAIFASLGVRHMRFTGGEPLIHPHLHTLIEAAQRQGIGKISVSTNGLLLPRKAELLRQSGVNNLNISLDSLDPEVFARVTRGGKLQEVLRGVTAAVVAGIPRIKLNVVLMRQENGHALADLVRYALDQHIDIRFIETMPLGEAGSETRNTDFLSANEARTRIEKELGTLYPAFRPIDNGPAQLYQFAGQPRSHIGFITPISDNFCATCNRVRLTASGRLVFCLGQENGMDLLPLLRGAYPDAAIAEQIRARIWQDKPERHEFVADPERSSRVFMMRLGG
ncbi:GTP 3',8-cyclase MoaA [Acidithiobacillus sp. M4-SHS-6]|uniref:GTP 3',8-cyclase MoaA n=1 Tax=Acidithiobacillus sp. M4-SHS-6 TaxID=3383024 RepID=UPI0039BE11A4